MLMLASPNSCANIIHEKVTQEGIKRLQQKWDKAMEKKISQQIALSKQMEGSQ